MKVPSVPDTNVSNLLVCCPYMHVFYLHEVTAVCPPPLDAQAPAESWMHNPLRRHKKRHNFVDTPSDKCHCNHGIGDSNHFLFSCHLFATQRVTLTTSVNAILQKYNLNHLGNNDHLYLYGHETLIIAENKLIILSTLKYIKETGRFVT